MGTYDIIGGTPRSPDEEEPCEFWDEENKCENTDCPKYNKEIEDCMYKDIKSLLGMW